MKYKYHINKVGGKVDIKWHSFLALSTVSENILNYCNSILKNAVVFNLWHEKHAKEKSTKILQD